MTLSFFVSGEPEAQGVGRAVGTPAGPRIFRRKKPWERHLSLVCEEHRQTPPWGGPCLLLAEFLMPRTMSLPKRKSVCHVVKPDCSNMLKAVEDALKGRIIRDDALLVAPLPVKRYARADEGPGVRIRLMQVDEPKLLSVYYDGILLGEVNLSSCLTAGPMRVPSISHHAEQAVLPGGYDDAAGDEASPELQERPL
ncbi:MAG TPA: RusA family crossover junction endodeoxyribonuclease [Phycisphaerae bacterium]|nr:RusA family crossover junction endodeoxyribonuclease [Phycisphaerae bacterium]